MTAEILTFPTLKTQDPELEFKVSETVPQPILNVTVDGVFEWAPDADQQIANMEPEKGAMKAILLRLRAYETRSWTL